jgi:hypothetical protein
MKRIVGAILVSACVLVGLAVARENVRAESTPAPVTSVSVPQAPELRSLAADDCGTNSDCKYGICTGGHCGACAGSADCKGWGTCSNGKCGFCGTNSDCTTFGECNSGKCSKSPY